MQITVLGSGLVGNAIVKELAQEKNYSITVIDINQKALDNIKKEARVDIIQADLQKSDNFSSLIAESGLVICAVPGFMGFKTLQKIIEAGKNVVDISFFGEDPFLLDSLAKSKGVTAVVDCGVAPGLCNIIAGFNDNVLEKIERYVCYVGGLPYIRQKPYEYKAVFSPSDVIEEYIRPARLIENNKEVVRPALSEVELLDFANVGTLEAFNTDGLRSLAHTMNIPYMKEKTLRYPGHADLMRTFRDSGFFNTTPVEINNTMVKPIDVTSKLLFDQWELKEGEEDFTVMRVIIEGKKDGQMIMHTYDLFDTYDKENRITSMARTTGYTCTIVARQVINGLFNEKGICPPEFIGRTDGCYNNLLGEYAKRNIQIKEEIINL
jgi:saccharopine dehydrogenase-like NADP-dependent oxidoreductase